MYMHTLPVFVCCRIAIHVVGFGLQMVRTYKRKTAWGAYGNARLQEALQSVRDGKSLRSAAAEYGIPRKTLRRHRDGRVANPGQIHLGNITPALTVDFENELETYIKQMEVSMYGLSTKDVRRLAFELAERVNPQHMGLTELAEWLAKIGSPVSWLAIQI